MLISKSSVHLLLDVQCIKSTFYYHLLRNWFTWKVWLTVFNCVGVRVWICDHCNLICCLSCCPACLPVDYKGGNGYIISPCSSVNSQSVHASNAVGNQCKNMKPLSAAKACIPQILPSKFKPKLLPPNSDMKESTTTASRHPKVHSCEDLCTDACATDFAVAEESECGQDSGFQDGYGPENFSPGIRRSASDFSSMYRTMHHIQRPSSVGCSPHGSVRNLTSLFEKAKPEGGERSEAGDGGNIPRHAVSSRVSAFEMIIQRSTPAPNRSSSLPTLHSSQDLNHPAHLYMTSAVSAQSLLVADATRSNAGSAGEVECRSCEEESSSQGSGAVKETVRDCQNPCFDSPTDTETEVEKIFSKGSLAPTHQNDSGPNSPSAFPLPHNHIHHHLLHHLNHQALLKPSTCKGSCPASYTRFTTILRHERQQAQQDKTQPEKKFILPGNLLLMGPAPFRLRKSIQSHQTRRTLSATKVTAGVQRPCSLSTDLGPVIPQRLSSLEVLERLSNGEGNNNSNLSNRRCLDANGNLLQPLSAHRRGGYISLPFPLSPSSLAPVVNHLSRVSLFTLSPSLHQVTSPPSISRPCGVFAKVTGGGVSISFWVCCLVLFLLLWMSMVPVMHSNTQEVQVSFGNVFTWRHHIWVVCKITIIRVSMTLPPPVFYYISVTSCAPYKDTDFERYLLKSLLSSEMWQILTALHTFS